MLQQQEQRLGAAATRQALFSALAPAPAAAQPNEAIGQFVPRCVPYAPIEPWLPRTRVEERNHEPSAEGNHGLDSSDSSRQSSPRPAAPAWMEGCEPPGLSNTSGAPATAPEPLASAALSEPAPTSLADAPPLAATQATEAPPPSEPAPSSPPRSADTQAARYVEARERHREAQLRSLQASMAALQAENVAQGERLAALEAGMQRNEDVLGRILAAVERPHPDARTQDRPPTASPQDSSPANPGPAASLSASLGAMPTPSVSARLEALPTAVHAVLREVSAVSEARAASMQDEVRSLRSAVEAVLGALPETVERELRALARRPSSPSRGMQDELRGLRATFQVFGGALPGIQRELRTMRASGERNVASVWEALQMLEARIGKLEDGEDSVLGSVHAMSAAVAKAVELKDTAEERAAAAYTARVEEAVGWFEQRMEMCDLGSFTARVEDAISRIEEKVERVEGRLVRMESGGRAQVETEGATGEGPVEEVKAETEEPGGEDRGKDEEADGEAAPQSPVSYPPTPCSDTGSWEEV